MSTKKAPFRINTNVYPLWISALKLWISIYRWWRKTDSWGKLSEITALFYEHLFVYVDKYGKSCG